MSTTNLIVLSDLHLADGRNVLEGFHARQQAAFEGLLQAALPAGSLGNASPATLILNGDCFDFLAVAPYLANGYETSAIALEKLEKIAAAHQPFFHALQQFLDGGGTVTFMPGNHDIELCFAEVQQRLAQLIDPAQRYGARLAFCQDQSYQPLPDVYIEHGHQYDFWNRASGLWDKRGKALNPQPEELALPLGTQYLHCAALPINLRYPYFDHFEPLFSTPRQIALLSILDPELVLEVARHIPRMMSYIHTPLKNLTPGDELVPARLFLTTIPEFAIFQQDMLAQQPEWEAVEAWLYSPDEREQKQTAAQEEFFTLCAGLDQPPEAAIQSVFQIGPEVVEDGTTRGMHNVLRDNPGLRVAVAGHTHTMRYDQVTDGQVYLNTASWTVRQIPPAPDEITPAVLAWLRQPDLENSPVHDITGAFFAWVSAEAGQPASARLCVWEGGPEGSYRILS